MAIVKQSTEKPVVGEMRKIHGVVKEWTGTMWVTIESNNVKKQPYTFKKAS